jgi:hypothetical protein
VRASVVHYRAAGNGTAFACYWIPVRKVIDERVACEICNKTPSMSYEDLERKRLHRRSRTHEPLPARTTDIKQVTCPECWKEIERIIRHKRGRAKP